MIYIGIDPDTKATGIGVVKGGKAVQALSATARGRTAYDRVEDMAFAIRECLGLVQATTAAYSDQVIVAIEWQKIRAGENARKAQNIADLLGIAYLAVSAVHLVFPLAKILRPLPAEWKGTIPKAVCTKRIITKLNLNEPDSVTTPLPKTQQSHAIDGLGLALWASKKG